MTLRLPLHAVEEMPTPPLLGSRSKRAIEDDLFPFERFCALAELESWRKEINRPLYHIHKWWAQRLGSVFRAILIGAMMPSGADVERSFYRPLRFPGTVVFDPFMGSGTTIGEALKLGCRAIGCDINPVAHFAVKNALGPHDRDAAIREFKSIEHDVADVIGEFYQAVLPDGLARCLYYFWVKVVSCPRCKEDVDLFNTYTFARHSNPNHVHAHALCPFCGDVQRTSRDAERVTCRSCRRNFDPRTGSANGARATCPSCRSAFRIIDVVRAAASPPNHRLYAKLVLTESGDKVYLPAVDSDHRLYQRAAARLKESGYQLPEGLLNPGYNTNQAINYGYLRWRDMFNDRQLLCLGTLAERISSIGNMPLRDLFTCLFSGVLEFNNLFASYKGEGTGAVRHMFSHHVLKPERMPLEANPWGTPKSSGSFSTLFKSRIIRAIDYCQDPFEIEVGARNDRAVARKVFGLSAPIGYPVASTFKAFDAGRRVYLACNDSSRTDLASASVDLVVTDPPFFDNVHYSQLADFFHVWQQCILKTADRRSATTRSEREVQQTDAETFSERLRDVWRECRRVLKPGGLLIFTYHHTRSEGWLSVFDAITQARFAIVAAHPIKADMAVAIPKRQAKEPAAFDIIVVCRKREDAIVSSQTDEEAWSRAVRVAGDQVDRLRRCGQSLSRNDIRAIVTAQIIRLLSTGSDPAAAHDFLRRRDGRIADLIESLDDQVDGRKATKNRPREMVLTERRGVGNGSRTRNGSALPGASRTSR